MKLILDTYDLVDIWRIRNPNSRKYTWRENTTKGLIQPRLDYFFIFRSIEYIVRKEDIKPSIKTDHSIILIQFKFIAKKIVEKVYGN